MSILAWIYLVSLALAIPLSILDVRQELREGKDLTLLDAFLYIVYCVVPLVNTLFAVYAVGYFLAMDSKKIVVIKGGQQ